MNRSLNVVPSKSRLMYKTVSASYWYHQCLESTPLRERLADLVVYR